MVLHTCPRCGKQFTHKGPYNYHVYKMKTPCAEIQTSNNNSNNAFECSKCGKSYHNKSNLNRHMRSYCTGKHESQINNNKTSHGIKSDKHTITTTYSDDDNTIRDTQTGTSVYNFLDSSFDSHDQAYIPQKNDTSLKCNYCGKKYTRSDNLNRHLKDYCKVKKQHIAEKEAIFQKLVQQMEEQNTKMNIILEENQELKSKLSTIDPSLTNNTANTINTNIDNSQNIQNNNIKLVAFGEEDLSYITTGICKRILNKGFRSVPVLIKYNHFHENKPQFHNVYISNMRDSHAAIYNGNQWKLISKAEAVERLIHDSQYYLVEKFEELFDELDPVTIKKFNRFINQSEDDEVLDGLKRDIKYMLYNNKNIPEKTRKLLQEQDEECKLIEG